MEKLKPLIDGLKAHGFWIFCGVTLLASIAVFYMVSGSLGTEEAASIGKITSAQNSAKSLEAAGVRIAPENQQKKEGEQGKENAAEVNDERAHPNQETISEMKKVVKEAAQATKLAWQKKYQLQRQFQVFDKETIDEPDVDFLKMLPAEKIEFKDDEEGLLDITVRTNYRDKIRRELPKLAALVGGIWKPNYEKNQPRKNELIIWTEDNQEYWQDRFTNFQSEWNWQAGEADEQGTTSNLPKTLQVLYTTEDLWLLRSILKDVIAKTVFEKGDVIANDLAVIKQIDHIFIGKVAEAPDEGLPGAGGLGGSSMGSGGMSSSNMMSSAGGMSGGNKKKGNSDTSLDPINGRYVDNEGKDIKAKDYRSLYAQKGSTDQKKTHWKIAKRVKVRIGLQMDTREIQSLLANCANATFPIEVQKLRVNKHKASKLKGNGGDKGGGGGNFGSSNQGMGGDAEDRAGDLQGAGGSSQAGGSMMPGGGSGSSGMAGQSGKQTMALDDEGYTQPVEIYGYIYIYNKVDNSMFKILNEGSTNP